MLFNENFGIAHINFNTGRVIIDYSHDEFTDPQDNAFDGLLRGFSKLIGGRIESLGMMQYKIQNCPYDFIIQWDNLDGIVISVENMNKIDDTVKYIRKSLYDINYNMLYEKIK